MRQDANPTSNSFTIRHVRQISPALAVAEVDLAAVRIGSIWITGVDTPDPQVSWPRSGRGYPVISINSDRLREAIEDRLVETVRSWPTAGEGRA